MLKIELPLTIHAVTYDGDVHRARRSPDPSDPWEVPMNRLAALREMASYV
jgi:hypothetical protein